MEHFSSAPLSISGKPILHNEEVEVKIISEAEILVENNSNPILNGGFLSITNLRMIFVKNEGTNGNKVGWALDMKKIRSVEDFGGFLGRSRRIKIYLTTSRITLHIRILEGVNEKNITLSIIEKQLTKKAWEYIQKQKEENEKETKFSTSNAGVTGLMRRQEKEIRNSLVITEQSLKDLDSLMNSARDVIQVIQRYSSYQQTKKKKDRSSIADSTTSSNHNSNNNDDNVTNDDEEDNEFDTMLQHIGMISPVTKSSAGKLFHQEISRQLVDFLYSQDRLCKMGNIASLTDIYCMYNRARGTELISPDDLIQAAEYINTLNVKLKFKRYPSGLYCIHLDTMDTEAAQIVILNYLNDINKHINNQNSANNLSKIQGINATILSKQMKISILIAKELLLTCETNGVLCRDESLEGLYFYQNIFNTFTLVT